MIILCGKELTEYYKMSDINPGETPSEWKEQIWDRLMYFKDNNLLPNESNRYFSARKTTYYPNIGIVICSHVKN